MDALEVLSWIKRQAFPSLRVVMLSGSLDLDLAEQALRLGAGYFQTKNAHPNELNCFVRRLEFLMVLLENRGPRKEKIPTRNNMLTIVDGRAPPWNEEVAAAAESGRNFILLLKSDRN